MKATVKACLDSLRLRRIRQMLEPMRIVRDYDAERIVHDLAEVVATEAEKRGMGDRARHYLLYHIQRRLLPKFVIADDARVMLDDDEFRAIFRRFSDDNWLSFERKWNFKELLRLTNGVDGHFAECGVYRGGSAYFMCATAQERGCEVHLFDSFEGLSTPAEGEDHHWRAGALSCSESEVQANLAEFDCFKTFKGWIPEAFDKVAEIWYCFLHVDVDLEQPTKDAIEFFYPRMNPGAVIVLDDHGSTFCPGARKTALEFFGDHGERVLDLSSGQGLVIKRQE